jgi:hypothetical protein
MIPANDREEIEKLFRRLWQDSAPLLEQQLATAANRQAFALKQKLDTLRLQPNGKSGFEQRWADFQSRHSEDLNSLARYCPDYPPRLFARHLPGMPVSLEALRAERAALAAILGWEVFVPVSGCTSLPVILMAPTTLRGGDTATATGTSFGSAVGTLTLHFESPSVTNIPLTIVSWSDTAVVFTVPTTPVPGVPLHADATLILAQHDPVPGGRRCSTKVNVTYEPPAIFLSAVQTSQVYKGIERDGSYSKDHSFTSPVLPARAEPLIVDGSDVLLDVTSLQFVTGGDDPPQASIVSGPFFTARRERIVTVRVTDDWAYNYRLSVTFL